MNSPSTVSSFQANPGFPKSFFISTTFNLHNSLANKHCPNSQTLNELTNLQQIGHGFLQPATRISHLPSPLTPMRTKPDLTVL